MKKALDEKFYITLLCNLPGHRYESVVDQVCLMLIIVEILFYIIYNYVIKLHVILDNYINQDLIKHRLKICITAGTCNLYEKLTHMPLIKDHLASIEGQRFVLMMAELLEK